MKAIDVDGEGNVYVSGWRSNDDEDDIKTMKYSNGGDLEWLEHHWGLYYKAFGYEMVVDDSGNVYVAGTYSNDNYMVTLKYDTSGNELWTAVHNASGFNVPADIDIDGEGNVIVSSVKENEYGFTDFVTVNITMMEKNSGSSSMVVF